MGLSILEGSTAEQTTSRKENDLHKGMRLISPIMHSVRLGEAHPAKKHGTCNMTQGISARLTCLARKGIGYQTWLHE
jgi:hypothetical protein